MLKNTGSHRIVAVVGTSLVEKVEEVAVKCRVPKKLLLTIGYANTHREMPPPKASTLEEGELDGKGTFGMMALVRNPSTDALGGASQLTGISIEKLKTEGRTSSAGRHYSLGPSERPDTLGDYLGAIDGDGGCGEVFEAVAGVVGRKAYADQVLRQ